MECLNKFLLLIILYAGSRLYAQEDLLNMMGQDTTSKNTKEYVMATWKSIRLANTQTSETVKKNHLEYRILHRFGNIANSNLTFNQIAHTFFGLDNASDIRFSLDYGITERLSIGMGRSRIMELFDFSAKYTVKRQTKDFKMPVTITLFGSLGYSGMSTARLYAEVQNRDFKTRESHRLSYFTQAIIASKITRRLSVQLMPAWYHRNFIVQQQNPNNQKYDGNNYFILGGAFRFKLTDRMSIISDYFYNLHPFYQNHPQRKNPLSLGIEMETGGHVFTLFFANNAAISELNYFTTTFDSWSKSQIKFSFCISRTFSLEGFKKNKE
jgi:hypothetical protein